MAKNDSAREPHQVLTPETKAEGERQLMAQGATKAEADAQVDETELELELIEAISTDTPAEAAAFEAEQNRNLGPQS